MRAFILLTLAIFVLVSCTDSGRKPAPGLPAQDTLPKEAMADSAALFMDLTKQILTAIKEGDYQTFSEFIHPASGTRFSPYGYIDTTKDVKLDAASFLNLVKKQSKINWGNYDGSGEEIFLTIDHYFKRFVYNADFLHAEKTSLNRIIGSGNSLNNLEVVYKDRDFTESYFAGFDKQFEGMDWSSLRLVFESYKDKVYLVAIIHDQWTI